MMIPSFLIKARRDFACEEKNIMEYPMIDMKGTGENMKMVLMKKGISVADVGKEIGVSDKSVVYKWTRGDSLPDINNLLALSMLLDVSINDILVTK